MLIFFLTQLNNNTTQILQEEKEISMVEPYNSKRMFVDNNFPT